MKKFRTIKDRKIENSFDDFPDLRGLDDNVLFEDSRWDSHLSILRGNPKEVLEICRAYGLEEVTSDDDFHFETKFKVRGDHKVQTLKSFYSALEISLKHPSYHLAITLHDTFREALSSRMNLTNSDIFDSHKDSKQMAGVFIDSPSYLFLIQAGLNLPNIGPNEQLHLSFDQLTHIQNHIQNHLKLSRSEKKKVG